MPSSLNFAVSDGSVVIATRFRDSTYFNFLVIVSKTFNLNNTGMQEPGSTQSLLF